MQSWVIGNWKKNPATLADVNELTTAIKSGLQQRQAEGKLNPEYYPTLMLVPSTLHLVPVAQVVADTDILVSCQDVSDKGATTGAFTGDCSALQMAEAGISWTLIGHSERRQYHRESGEVLIAKMRNALEQGLGVIFCIGETLVAHDLNKTLPVVRDQLSVIAAFEDLEEYADRIMVAYEPIWAIGTGKIPTIDDVEMVNKEIKDYLTNINSTLANTPLLYGGSVKPDNAEQFASSKLVDGALIGGAALDADKFLSIADTFCSVKEKMKDDDKDTGNITQRIFSWFNRDK